MAGKQPLSEPECAGCAALQSNLSAKEIRLDGCVGAILKNNRYHIALLFDNICPHD